MKPVALAFFFLIFTFLLSAQNEENVIIGVYELCSFLHVLIPIITMLMLVGAGAVYAGGQIMGAETRARTNVWATTMLTGALIGTVIVLLAPTIFDIMYPGIAYVC